MTSPRVGFGIWRVMGSPQGNTDDRTDGGPSGPRGRLSEGGDDPAVRAEMRHPAGTAFRTKISPLTRAMQRPERVRPQVPRRAIEPVGLDVRLDPARDLVADAPALGQAAAEVVRGDADRRDRHDLHRAGARPEVGQAVRPRVDAGAVGHDDRRQPGDPVGLPARTAGRPGCRRRSGRRVRRPAARDGPPPASRRCSAGPGRRASSSETSNAGWPATAIRTISSRCASAVRSPGLCGGTPATTNQTRSSPHASRHELGQDQVPQVDRVERAAEQPQSHRLVGPPGSVRYRSISCGQACRNRVKWGMRGDCVAGSPAALAGLRAPLLGRRGPR